MRDAIEFLKRIARDKNESASNRIAAVMELDKRGRYKSGLLEHTKRITDYMRKRAGENVSYAAPYLRGWHDALTEVADEIDDNESSGGGHSE